MFKNLAKSVFTNFKEMVYFKEKIKENFVVNSTNISFL